MSYVQIATTATTGSSTPATITLTGVTGGNTIVVFGFNNSNGTAGMSGVSSSLDGAFAQSGSTIDDTTNNNSASCFVLKTTSSGTHTLTLTSAGGPLGGVAFEVTGTVNGTAKGQFQSAPGTGAGAVKTGSTFGSAGDTIVAASENTGTGTALSVPAGSYTQRFNSTLGFPVPAIAESQDSISGAIDCAFTAGDGATTYLTLGIAVTPPGGATIATTTGTWSWSSSYGGTLIPGSVGYPDTPRVSGPRTAGPSGFRLYPTAGGGGPTTITGIQGTWTWAPSTANFSIQGTTGTWTWNPSTATFSSLISGTTGTWMWSPSTASFSSLVSGTTGTWTWAKSTATFNSLLSTGTGTWTWAPSTATFNELLVTTTGTWAWNASTATFTQLINGSLGTWTWASSTATFGGGTVINGTSGTNDWTWAASSATFPLETTTGTWSWGATTATFSALLSTTTGTWTWAASTANFTQLIAGTSGTNDWTWAPSTATFINGIPTINGISGINDWMWAGSQSIIVPGSIGHRGGDDAWRRKHRKEIFDDVDRRQRLREAITQAFGSEATRPEVQKYVRPVKAHTLRPVLNWDQIERNFEEIEQILPILQARAVRERELDQDDDDLMEVI